MTNDQSTLQADTEVDLTNCDREPIHILGHVQDYGCLIALSSDWMVIHASTNCKEMIGFTPDDLVGRRLLDLLPAETVHALRTRLQLLSGKDGTARLFCYDLFADGRLFDVSLHSSRHGHVFEFEPRDAPSHGRDDAAMVQGLIGRVRTRNTIEEMAQVATRGLSALSGFDRVMVYRFEEDDSGTVIAETHKPGMEPFLGLRYPASDIPKQARALYLRSPLRIISDVDAPVHAIEPAANSMGQPLDLSLSVTRAVSPIHLEYLRNMGVRASMSVSIIRQGKLWGLFACHHNTPHRLDFELRSAVELYCQLFTYELAQLENDQQLADMEAARHLHDRLMTQFSDGVSLSDSFRTILQDIEAVVSFDGAAIYSDGSFEAVGSAPTEDEFMGLARFLNTTPPAQIYAVDQIAKRYPDAERFADRVAGVLALPISRTPRDYLVLFRREVAQNVKWAGNPEKPVEFGPNGARLVPRNSFEAWKEIVRGRSAPWRQPELRAADALRITLLEVVLKIADEANSARKRAQDQQELLIAELNHRVRNILNLIRGLVTQGREDHMDLDAFQDVLDDRIHALARAHDLLTEAQWGSVGLRALIQTEVKAYVGNASGRVSVIGDDIDLTPTAYTTLALVIHELMTNSVKYGALSVPAGAVDVTVQLASDGTAHIQWRDRNGPAVTSPDRKGFGTTIIERSIPYELQGTAEVRYRMTGLEASFMVPGIHVRPATKSAVGEVAEDNQAETAPVDFSGEALVVEDNMIIALDASDMVSELGATQVHTASGVAAAMSILDAAEIRYAIVDVNLGSEMSFPVVDRCLADGILVALATGYGASDELTEKYPSIPVIKKPYLQDDVQTALAKAQTLQS